MSDAPLESVELDAAVAVVAAVDGRAWLDVALGAIPAVVVLAAAGASGYWLVGAIVGCVLFPLLARLARATRLRRLRAGLERLDAESRARVVNAAWERASPGQRAALQMVLKNRS